MKRIDYSAVDWTKHDAAIARDLGVSRAAVMNARRRAGAPPSKVPTREQITQKEWIRRAQLLIVNLMRWDKLEDGDLDEVMPLVDEVFEEARALHKLQP